MRHELMLLGGALLLLPAPAGGQPAEERAKPADVGPGDFGPPHYDQGFVLVSTADPERLPYMLRLNHVSQFKYTNSMAVERTYTDHLGRVNEVRRRNDIQLTRDAFYFSGFVFDRRLDFNILIFTSSATLVATAAGYVGFVFDKAFALRAGYFSLPSVRSLTGTYPFFHGTDRSMANNYMRPGFTQGAWANGELFSGFNYIAMLGNSLNTLDIKASKIDDRSPTRLRFGTTATISASRGTTTNTTPTPAIRVGTAFTFAR